MTGKLVFKLPEDRREFLRAQKATEYLLVIWHLHEHLIKQLALDPDLPGSNKKTLDFLDEQLNQYSIDMDNELE